MKCKVDKCKRRAFVQRHGLCNPHVKRLYRYGDVLADQPIRKRSKNRKIPAYGGK